MADELNLEEMRNAQRRKEAALSQMATDGLLSDPNAGSGSFGAALSASAGGKLALPAGTIRNVREGDRIVVREHRE